MAKAAKRGKSAGKGRARSGRAKGAQAEGGREPRAEDPSAGQRGAWDLAYERRGAAWNGRVPPLPDLPPLSLALDLGCGDGRVLRAMLEKDWRAVGADFSRTGLVKATKRPDVADAVRAGKAELVLTDATALPFAERVFDVVAAVHVLAHLDGDGRKAAVAEAARVLKPGGTLVFADFSAGDFRSADGEDAGDRTRVRNGIRTHYFDAGEVASLLSGFDVESVDAVGWSVRIGGRMRRREEIVALARRPR